MWLHSGYRIRLFTKVYGFKSCPGCLTSQVPLRVPSATQRWVKCRGQIIQYELYTILMIMIIESPDYPTMGKFTVKVVIFNDNLIIDWCKI